MHPPRAFISHSSQDHAIVERLDADLRAAGIDPWSSFWEIRAGDSIVQKINEGLRDCQAFLIVISKHSVASAWVNRELDAATLQQIQGKATIIPVRLDDSPVPRLLEPLKYVDLARDYSGAIREIVDVLLGRDRRPAVASHPAKGSASGGDTELRGAAAQILLRSVERAANDEEFWGMDADEAMTEFNLTAGEYANAVEELEHVGLVILDGNMGHASGYARARIKPWAFFQVIDQVIPGVDARAEMGDLLRAIATGGRDGISSQAVRDVVKVPEIRARWYVEVLAQRGLIEVHGNNNWMLPLGFDWAQTTAAGRRELQTPSLVRLVAAEGTNATSHQTGPESNLSREARMLLFHAARDVGGHILASHTFGGRHVHANGIAWPKVNSPRAAAVWYAALNELEQAGFVERGGSNGDVYTMTAAGFTAADAVGIGAEE